MESDDVGILDISDSSMGVSVVTYVLVGMGEVLNGDNLLASIQVIHKYDRITILPD